MVCSELEPEVAGWEVQMNPLSYGGIPCLQHFFRSRQSWKLQQDFVVRIAPTYTFAPWAIIQFPFC